MNAPYYSKYAPCVFPSARESAAQSHFSDTARQRHATNQQGTRDMLDFSLAQQMAEKNKEVKKVAVQLPTTPFEVSANCGDGKVGC